MTYTSSSYAERFFRTSTIAATTAMPSAVTTNPAMLSFLLFSSRWFPAPLALACQTGAAGLRLMQWNVAKLAVPASLFN